MCISKVEIESRVQEIRKYKAMAEEAAEIQKKLEAEQHCYCGNNGIEKWKIRLFAEQVIFIQLGWIL